MFIGSCNGKSEKHGCFYCGTGWLVSLMCLVPTHSDWLCRSVTISPIILLIIFFVLVFALKKVTPKVTIDKLQRVLTPQFRCSAVQSSRGCCSPSCIGWCTWATCTEHHDVQPHGACTAMLHSTWWISAIRPLELHHSNNFDLPADESWSFHIAGQASPPGVLSQRFVSWCGIPCWTTCAILLLAETHSDSIWKHLCSLRTSACSALEVSCLCTVSWQWH